jgi:hypothetical protein
MFGDSDPTPFAQGSSGKSKTPFAAHKGKHKRSGHRKHFALPAAESEFVAFHQIKSEDTNTPIVFADSQSARDFDQPGNPVFENDTEVMSANLVQRSVFEGETKMKNGVFEYPKGMVKRRKATRIGFKDVRASHYRDDNRWKVADPSLIISADPGTLQPSEAVMNGLGQVVIYPNGMGQQELVDQIKSKVGGEKLYNAGQQIYNVVKSFRKPKAAVAAQAPALPAQRQSGLSMGTILLMAGGGVALLAVIGIILKRRS